MDPQETFIARLRRHRQRNDVALDDIVLQTRVKRELLEAFERNDLSEWPRGVYARAWVRAYALAVGLDPIDTVDEFCRLFPQGDRRTGPTVQEIATIVAHPSEYQDEFAHTEDRRRTTDAPPTRSWHAPIRQVGRQLWVRVAHQIRSVAGNVQARPGVDRQTWGR
jgi:hypothetical protein